MFPLIILLFFFASIINVVFKFWTTDADFTLLSKKLKREEIEDKVVWITGASRGIGEVLARQLASLGAKLILSARNQAELERVKSQLTGKHAPGDVKILPLDLASGEASIREAVEKAESFFPESGVDYMIHNAVCERPKSAALDVTEESLKATFEVNVFGTISLTRLLAPYMIKRGRGHFVVMSSAAGKVPAPAQTVYSASKFALNGYFHSLRSELFQKGIKVTVVCPGPIETSKDSGAGSSGQPRLSEKRVSSERCAELTIIAASNGLKEAWISYQPVLGVMYLVQYMPSVGFWLMDKVGEKRIEVAAQKGNTYSLDLLFGKSKKP
uniref:Ketoreductase domain-containing protein n=1 Tax=Opuntia streptacantha TaxID=393608 RepID=A0A7C8ZLF2_OPUST